MLKFLCFRDEASCSILDTLEFVNVFVRKPIKERITVVDTRGYEGMDEPFSLSIIKVLPDLAYFPDGLSRRTTNICDMIIQGEFIIQ